MRRRTSLISGCVALAVLAGMAANESAPPLIETVPVPGDPPLTLRFSITNRGWLLPIGNVDFTCVPDQIAGRNANGASVKLRGAAFPLNVDIDLGPRDSFQYTCPLAGPNPPDRADRIEAHVELRYKRLGQKSEAHSAELIWDSQSKIWTAAR